MASNGSSGPGGQDPWRRSSDEGPPDLMQLIKKLFNKKPNLKKTDKLTSGNLSSFLVPIVLFLIIVWALSGIFLVDPAEQAVVLRFGKFARTVGPGPHWVARFIETEQKVNVQRIHSFPYQSEMLSKDENIVSVKLQVQYRVDNLRNYLFNVTEPEKTLQQAVSSALRQMVGQMDLDPLITTGRQELTQQVTSQLKEILNNYKLGIEVVDVALQEVKPPSAVTPAFDDVVKAREDRQSFINKADAYAKNRVLAATGIAARLEQEADAYQYTVIARAKGDTARYLALLKPYQQSPEVTRQRLYLQTMSHVLHKTKNVIMDSNNLIYLPLDQMLKSSHTTGSTTSKDTVNDENNQGDIDDQSNVDSSDNSALKNYPERPSYFNKGSY